MKLFKAVIHNNRYLGNIHLYLSSANYEEALTILEEGFSNTRQAAVEYLGAIIDIKKLEYRFANDVMSMYTTVRNCLARLLDV